MLSMLIFAITLLTLLGSGMMAGLLLPIPIRLCQRWRSCPARKI